MSETIIHSIDGAIEAPTDLDDRAAAAKRSEADMERLIKDFEAFLRSRVYRHSIHADDTMREDMHSAAMLAFYEAVQKYDAMKGHFFPFADRVVHTRLIDFARRASRQEDGRTVPLEDEDEDQATAQSAAIAEISISAYDESQRHEQLADEIEQFKAELSTWGLTMASLVKQSPKHSKLREEYRSAIAKIAKVPGIIQTIQLKRYFPVNEVANISGLPRKKVERARNFILASLIIEIGDYEYLLEYVGDRRGTV
jgi:RNA polymerase sigma factor